MSLIEKEYFTLSEVIDALGMPWTDIIYLAENGHLRLSVLVFQLPVDCGYCDHTGQDNFDRAGVGDPSNLTGLVDLGDRDAHLILKNGSAAVADFKAKPKEHCNIAAGARPQTFKKDDLLLRRSERARLESLVKSKTAATRAEHFTHSHGYREVTINGHRISLGARQADVVRQLHEAALRGNPWRNGKELLRNAGSESNRMHDLFKSKRLEWPLLIDSDGRGLYRLAISDRIELPGKRAKK